MENNPKEFKHYLDGVGEEMAKILLLVAVIIFGFQLLLWILEFFEIWI